MCCNGNTKVVDPMKVTLDSYYCYLIKLTPEPMKLVKAFEDAMPYLWELLCEGVGKFEIQHEVERDSRCEYIKEVGRRKQRIRAGR